MRLAGAMRAFLTIRSRSSHRPRHSLRLVQPPSPRRRIGPLRTTQLAQDQARITDDRRDLGHADRAGFRRSSDGRSDGDQYSNDGPAGLLGGSACTDDSSSSGTAAGGSNCAPPPEPQRWPRWQRRSASVHRFRRDRDGRGCARGDRPRSRRCSVQSRATPATRPFNSNQIASFAASPFALTGGRRCRVHAAFSPA